MVQLVILSSKRVEENLYLTTGTPQGFHVVLLRSGVQT